MNIDKTMKSPGIQTEKVNVTNIYVIGREHCNKLYYEILYKEVGNDFYNTGYGSFNLDQVLCWMHHCFEVVPADEYERRNAKDTNVPGKWIPCSERLPKKPEIYGDSDGYIVQTRRVEQPFIGYWDGREWTDEEVDVVAEVIAWMPLPEPYREVDDEQNQ